MVQNGVLFSTKNWCFHLRLVCWWLRSCGSLVASEVASGHIVPVLRNNSVPEQPHHNSTSIESVLLHNNLKICTRNLRFILRLLLSMLYNHEWSHVYLCVPIYLKTYAIAHSQTSRFIFFSLSAVWLTDLIGWYVWTLIWPVQVLTTLSAVSQWIMWHLIFITSLAAHCWSFVHCNTLVNNLCHFVEWLASSYQFRVCVSVLWCRWLGDGKHICSAVHFNVEELQKNWPSEK